MAKHITIFLSFASLIIYASLVIFLPSKSIMPSNPKYVFLAIGVFFFALNSFFVYVDFGKILQMLLEIISFLIVLTIAILQYLNILTKFGGFINCIFFAIIAISRYSLSKSHYIAKRN